MERTVDHVAVGRRSGQGDRLRFLEPGGVQLSGVRQGVQAEEQPEEPSEVGMRQGATVPVSPLRLQGEAEDAHRAAHGTDAQREDLQAGARLRSARGMGWGGVGGWMHGVRDSRGPSTSSSGRERPVNKKENKNQRGWRISPAIPSRRRSASFALGWRSINDRRGNAESGTETSVEHA